MKAKTYLKMKSGKLIDKDYGEHYYMDFCAWKSEGEDITIECDKNKCK
jgi:hypothetical protein